MSDISFRLLREFLFFDVVIIFFGTTFVNDRRTMEEILAGKVGASLLTRIVRSLCSGCCKDRRKKKVAKRERKCWKCWKCCFAGLPDEIDSSVLEKHLEYKDKSTSYNILCCSTNVRSNEDKSTSYNILCCSTNVRSNEFEFDMELYKRNSRHVDDASMCERSVRRDYRVNVSNFLNK